MTYKRTCSQVFSNRSLKVAANVLKSILRWCLAAFIIKPLFFKPGKYAQTSKFLFCSPSLRNKLFVAYLMNHSALRVSAMKINTPAATQISVGFVFLEKVSPETNNVRVRQAIVTRNQ